LECGGCKSNSQEWTTHDDDCLVSLAVGNEHARWQEAVYLELRRNVPRPNDIDGGDCDSGDPLDFTLSEITQGFGQIVDISDCSHPHLDGIDQTNGEDKVWRCQMCKRFYRFRDDYVEVKLIEVPQSAT
jgi:hypothetical protein